MELQFDKILEYLPFFFKGALFTIGLTAGGILLGSILGLFLSFGKMIPNYFLRLPFVWYINLFRGTPLFVQVLIIHFGVVPMFMTPANPIVTGLIALTLNGAAYIAEIFRAGIQSIDKGQMEAARTIGMTKVQAMRYIILPQAFKRMIPPLGNEFIVLLKDSSILAVIAAPELMYWGRAMQGQYYIVWEPYLTVAVIYLILTLSLTYLLNRVERRLAND
ncbi:amino acid ABC transporter permease [Lottiidibacillus patelloidae]|uniref:Amino acid ABC transporter permease n=1 Tax=Lottiidibacillus patelloidae TaxID=2670334 RepID=A0A263BYT2_9BACI|nr:amino acid ABC transporter permease [Lottiidibacillus patelloidae]OZM58326.1 amino acid ABC transporter permease [Lottiidibacillus patelloidae]